MITGGSTISDLDPLPNGAVPQSNGTAAAVKATPEQNTNANSSSSTTNIESTSSASSSSKKSISSNGIGHGVRNNTTEHQLVSSSNSNSKQSKDLKSKQHQEKQNNSSLQQHHSSVSSPLIEDIEFIEYHLTTPAAQHKKANINDFKGDSTVNEALENDRNSAVTSAKVLHKQQNGFGGKQGKGLGSSNVKDTNSSQSASKRGKNNNASSAVFANNKDEAISRYGLLLCFCVL